jgi:sec-independent protein translocase protein TatC
MKEMSLMEHLTELRTTIVRMILIVFVSFIICFHFSNDIQELLLAPLRVALGDGGKIIFTGLLDKVLAEFQVAFWSCLILSSPLWFHQIWLFIKPGLYPKELSLIRAFLIAGFFLFCLGVCFCYFIVFPFTFETVMGFGVSGIDAYLSLQDYLVLASKILLVMGLLFQLPNVMVILGFMELVTKYSLRQYRSYVYLAFAVASAIITPPDVLTMMALWIPLVALYEVGIWSVSMIVHPYLSRKYMQSTN